MYQGEKTTKVAKLVDYDEWYDPITTMVWVLGGGTQLFMPETMGLNINVTTQNLLGGLCSVTAEDAGMGGAIEKRITWDYKIWPGTDFEANYTIVYDDPGFEADVNGLLLTTKDPNVVKNLLVKFHETRPVPPPGG